MRKFFPFIILVLCFGFSTHAQTESVTQLTPIQFKEISASEETIVIDVRTPEEFLEGHIDGAKNIDLQNSNFEEKISKFDTLQPVYLYCRSGNRSGLAAAILKEMGFKEIFNLEGGILKWEEENLPVKN